MPTSGEQLVQELQEDLACPDCSYNLRGLRGATITCPECGATFDVARLLTQRWRGPWHTAPGFTVLLLPVAAAAGTILALGVALVIDDKAGRGPLWTITAAVLGAGLWGALLWNAARRFGSPRGALLALLAHVLFLGYVVSVYGFLVAVLRALLGGDVLAKVTWCLVGIALACLLAGCRRGERYIAEQCIRRYLAHAAAPSLAPPRS